MERLKIFILESQMEVIKFEQWFKKNQLQIMGMYMLLAVIGVIILPNGVCFAAGGLPWEGPLQQVLTSMDDTVIRIVAGLAVIGCGLALSFGEMGAVAKRMVQIVFGIAIAAGFTSILAMFGR